MCAACVARGGLSAVASGDVFASPSAKQIITAIDAAGSTAGTVLILLNYTGDCLHFGLAAQMVNSRAAAPAGESLIQNCARTDLFS